jgi:hypothetical protein
VLLKNCDRVVNFYAVSTGISRVGPRLVVEDAASKSSPHMHRPALGAEHHGTCYGMLDFLIRLIKLFSKSHPLYQHERLRTLVVLFSAS